MSEIEKNRDTVYKPNEVPEKIERSLFIGYGIGKYNAGRIVVDDHDYNMRPDTESKDFAAVLLKELKLKIDLPKMNINIKDRMIEVLEAEKQKVLAESHRQIFRIDEDIRKLQLLEHKPSEGTAT